MTIEQVGERWRGTTAADLEAFLGDHATADLAVARVVRVVCPCGHTGFEVTVADAADAVRRRCSRCGVERLMLDSAERWDEEDEPDALACACEGEVFEVAVGVAATGEASAPWAVLVGTRCVECGLLDLGADWDTTGSLDELGEGA